MVSFVEAVEVAMDGAGEALALLLEDSLDDGVVIVARRDRMSVGIVSA